MNSGNTFRVHFINFGYFSQEEPRTLEDAQALCRKAGFQANVYQGARGAEELVGTWCPLGGWRAYV